VERLNRSISQGALTPRLACAVTALAISAALFHATPTRAEDALPPGHPPIAAQEGETSGFELPLGLRLHGRFDFAYERHAYTDDPSEGLDAFRNFHRFLFLERHVKDDPFYFNAEVLGLNFYELGFRLRGGESLPWRFGMTAGKVLVPFGSDPLFHHAYGGRVGADQRFVPVVWGEFGLKANLELDLGRAGLRVDAYTTRGFALRDPEAQLNLQTNAAPLDDLNFAGGGRISASYGPATIHYSVMGGNLDHGRAFAMQGLDVGLWRLPLPVLEDFALTAGVVRADVWGGEGESYYHFADYLQLRYYPTDCLYLQYRTGLDMRDNREGLFADANRLDKLDTSAHSLALGYVRGHFSLVIQHLWQMELVDEQDDDFFRITAAYEF
jgi:hypothetical protein